MCMYLLGAAELEFPHMEWPKEEEEFATNHKTTLCSGEVVGYKVLAVRTKTDPFGVEYSELTSPYYMDFVWEFEEGTSGYDEDGSMFEYYLFQSSRDNEFDGDTELRECERRDGQVYEGIHIFSCKEDAIAFAKRETKRAHRSAVLTVIGHDSNLVAEGVTIAPRDGKTKGMLTRVYTKVYVDCLGKVPVELIK